MTIVHRCCIVGTWVMVTILTAHVTHLKKIQQENHIKIMEKLTDTQQLHDIIQATVPYNGDLLENYCNSRVNN